MAPSSKKKMILAWIHEVKNDGQVLFTRRFMTTVDLIHLFYQINPNEDELSLTNFRLLISSILKNDICSNSKQKIENTHEFSVSEEIIILLVVFTVFYWIDF